MARGRHYAKLSLSNAARLSFSDLCILLFMFLSLCRLCVCVFLCSHWSLVDVPLIFFCPADHVPDWQPRVLLGMVEARSVNVKKTTTTLNSRLLSGHFGVVAGTLRGFRFPICYGSVGVQLTRLLALCQGILTSECVWKNLNAIVLQVTCTMQQSSRVFFLFACLKGCFRLSLSIRNKKKRTVTSKKHASRPANLLLCLLQP